MSDISERKVSGPPPRAPRQEQKRSRLLKANRDAEQVAEPAVPSSIEPVESGAQEPATRDAEPLSAAPEDAQPAATPTASADETASAPAPASAVDAAPAAVEPKKLVNATYRVPEDLKQRLNSAISAVKTFEGWTSAEEYVQDLFERDIKRIQDEYNNGDPFPLRTRAMPRGRPIPPKIQ